MASHLCSVKGLDGRRMQRHATIHKAQNMLITRFVCNMVRENTYLIHDDRGDAALIDCGAFYSEEQEAIIQSILENHLTLKRLLNTHGHFDHVFGAKCIQGTYGIGIEIDENEKDTYKSAATQMMQFIGQPLPLELAPVANYFHDGDILTVGDLNLHVIATPGHTPGGVCFYLPEEKVLFSGDSLFREEIGRCDLPGGNESQLVNALKSKVLVLPDDVTVYPGHGEATTIGHERAHNPYLQ